MPDFAMCFGEEKLTDGSMRSCPLRNTCYRFIAEPESEDKQTFFSNVPFEKDDCQYYWKTYCDDIDEN